MNENEMLQLNAWIAEHVLGWKWYRYLPEDNHAYSGCRTLANRQHKHLVKANGGEPLAEDAFYNIPKPTTDPAAAFAVLEKCCQRWNRSIPVCYSKGWPQPWSFDREKADTLPLAICLFAKQCYSKV